MLNGSRRCDPINMCSRVLTSAERFPLHHDVNESSFFFQFEVQAGGQSMSQQNHVRPKKQLLFKLAIFIR